MPFHSTSLSTTAPTPTPDTRHPIQHRQNIARIVSSLRSVRPHTPFYRLAAHRVPTLWTLYRGLLRASPSPIVQSHVRALFREHRHLTSPALTKIQLEKGQRRLDAFRKAERGDERLRSVLRRFERLIVARRDNIKMRSIVDDALFWQHRLLNRPIFSPSLLRPSLSNGPLPRLKPQPDHISGMIHKRRVARARRIEKQRVLLANLQDLQAEAKFEEATLAATTETTAERRCFSGPHLAAAWRAPVLSHLALLQASFERDAHRATTTQPPRALLNQLRSARREKVENKTRERAREARGEVLACTRRRARLGFPAHVLGRWGPAERRERLIARRSVGAVGYVGMVKRKFGYGVRPGEEEEEERRMDEEMRERLDRQVEEVRRINQSRRDSEERIAEGQ